MNVIITISIIIIFIILIIVIIFNIVLTLSRIHYILQSLRLGSVWDTASAHLRPTCPMRIAPWRSWE